MKKSATVDDYIEGFPGKVQAVLKKIRGVIKSVIPGGVEAVSYGIPCFKLGGKYVIYFAAWKSHVSVYPIPKGDARFRKEIAPFVAGRGTLKFPLDEPVPYDLIKKVARASLAYYGKGSAKASFG